MVTPNSTVSFEPKTTTSMSNIQSHMQHVEQNFKISFEEEWKAV